MKAISNINGRVKRTVATIGFTVFFSAMSFGQGLLVEGVLNLFNKSEDPGNGNPTVVYTNYSPRAAAESRLSNLKDFAAELLLDDETTEEEVTIESWMTHPYISESFNTEAVEVNFEESVEVESWMTTPFETSSSLGESDMEVENWMTAPFETSPAMGESDIAVENWMTTPFETGTLEEEIEVEEWMTEPYSNATEDRIEVEEWMTRPFNV